MKKQVIVFITIGLLTFILITRLTPMASRNVFQPQTNAQSVSSKLEAGSLDVCFSPEGGCTRNIVSALDDAKKSIFVQAYSFTSQSIADALVHAQKRGVKVQVILDRSQVRVKRGQAHYLVESGVPVRIDAAHSIAHNKVMIIDDLIVITGSFNFTNDAALHNAENLLIIDDATLAKRYSDNWLRHAEHSDPYSIWLAKDAIKKAR